MLDDGFDKGEKELFFVKGSILPDMVNNVKCGNSLIDNQYFEEKLIVTPEEYQIINYRGSDSLLWKTDFAKLFLDRFPGLRIVCKRIIKYKNNENLDIMYLLEKRNG